MHRYYKHIGDYAKKTGRLNMLQHGAFNMLMDACYDREVFPTEQEALEWTWASTPEEEQAVRFVLSRFFKLQDDGRYVQSRIQDEIEAYKINGVINRLTAISREAKKQNNPELAKDADDLRLVIKNDPFSKSHAAWSSVVDALKDSHESAPNQEPINQEPITNKPKEEKEGAGAPERDDVASSSRSEKPKKPKKSKVEKYFDELAKLDWSKWPGGVQPSSPVWFQWMKNRAESKSAKSTQLAMDLQREKIVEAVRLGYDAEDVYRLMAGNGWIGFKLEMAEQNLKIRRRPTVAASRPLAPVREESVDPRFVNVLKGMQL